MSERKRNQMNTEEPAESQSALEMIQQLQATLDEVNALKQWMDDEGIVEQEKQEYLDKGLEPPE